MQIDSDGALQNCGMMSDNSEAPGVSISVVDELEEQRNAQKLWGLYQGLWPTVTLVTLALSIIATGVAFFLPLYLPSFLYSTGLEVWTNHKWIGFFGSIFIHVGFFHLIFNCYWFWIFGRVLEIELGRLRYIVLILGSAWATGCTELALSGNPGVGLSGVLYTFFGYMLVNRKECLAFSRLLPSKTVTWLVLWLFICIGLTYSGTMKVANGAHFAGLAFGCAVGKVGQPSLRRLSLATVAMAVACSFPLIWAPWQEGWLVSKASQSLNAKDTAGASVFLDRVLLKNSKNAWALFMQGQIYTANKQYQRAKESLTRAAVLTNNNADVANSIGWLLSTCPNDTVRDGKAALRYAKAACEKTDWKTGAYLDTYAAALAETNDFSSAVTWANKAIEIAPEQKTVLQEHMQAFKAGRPWREPN